MTHNEPFIDRPLLKLAFVDRDGTINVDRGHVHRLKDWEFTPGCDFALRLLREAGYEIAVVTNQSGIAAGMYTTEDAELLHEFMRSELAARGVHIDAVVFCPHARDGNCDCRKPKTGMARQVEAILGCAIDFARSWTIGDKVSDTGFGQSLGTKTALIRSRYWTEAEIAAWPTLIVDSLYDAARRIAEEKL
jgi:D-glycero-D-manno-heptose 1,7-bisphosphate phosphatase